MKYTEVRGVRRLSEEGTGVPVLTPPPLVGNSRTRMSGEGNDGRGGDP